MIDVLRCSSHCHRLRGAFASQSLALDGRAVRVSMIRFQIRAAPNDEPVPADALVTRRARRSGGVRT